ncbi:unnamed protein product, partial [marine sediment metagenome]
VTKTLPRTFIHAIEFNTDTAITVSAGTHVEAYAVKAFRIIFNGKQIINIDGLIIADDTEIAGPELLRELNQYAASVASTAGYYKITFDPPLPPGDVQIEIQFTSAQHIGADGGGTVTAGDFDLEVLIEPNYKGKTRIPYWRSGYFADGAESGDRHHYLPALSFPLRILMLCTHDGATRSSTAYNSLEISYLGDVIWDGAMAKLTNEMQQKSGVAASAGCFIKVFPQGLKISPETLKLKLNLTAGTAVYTEWVAICW